MKFRQKLMLCMVWLLTLSYGIGGMVLIDESFRSGLDEQCEAAAGSFQMVLQTVELVNQADQQRNLTAITAVLERMEDSAHWSALRLWGGSSILYESGQGFYEAEPGQQPYQIIFSKDGDKYLQSSSSLGESGLRLDAVFPLKAVYETRQMQIAAYRRSLLLLLLGGGLLSYLAAWWLTKPLSEVSGASRRLARGELSARAQVNTRDEVGLMAADFNAMADRLEENVAELTDAVTRQEQFMGSFAHELKTPMTSVIGYAELLCGGSLDAQEAEDAARYIYSEGKRLEALSMKLLELLAVKNQPPQLVKTDLGELLSAMAEHLAPIYRRHGVELHLQADPFCTMAEPDLFYSLVLNLLDNARKAQCTDIHICLKESGLLEIADNGTGIPAENLPHLTEAFYRVDKARSRSLGGAGLGLTLCQRIAELHGASLSFASVPGKGTTVTIQIPEVSQ